MHRRFTTSLSLSERTMGTSAPAAHTIPSLLAATLRWPALFWLGSLFGALGVTFFGFAASASAQSYSGGTPDTQSFTVGSTGFSATSFNNVPSPAINLLAAPSTTLTLGAGTGLIPANGTGAGSSGTWAQLTDGSYGLVPASGGGGPGEIEVGNNYSLTYTFAAASNLSTIDVFSGWGDGGRSTQEYTIYYSTAANPTPGSFQQLGATVGSDNNTGTNGEWTQLTLSGMNNITAIEFYFNTQENGYVGYTQLAVLGTTAPTALTWTGGSSNGSWDNVSTNNWVNSTPPGTGATATYADGAAVTFADAATNTAITIQAGGVAPSAVYFTNTLTTYSLTNTGSDTNGITGAATVSVSGGGTVTFNSPNTYSGTTTVSHGTLDLANQNAVQNSTLTLSGGTVRFDQAVAANAFTVGGLAGTSNLSLQNNATSPAGIALTIGNSTNAIYGGVLSGSGGSLTKIGTGIQTLFGANTYSGSTTVSAGTLRLGAGAQTIGSPSLAEQGNYTYTAASNDLLKGLSPTTNTNTLGGQQGNGGVNTGGVGVLTNQSVSNTGVEGTDLPNLYSIGSGAQLTYLLGSAANGYSISAVNIYSEWNDTGRSQITLNDIAYSTVANPTVFAALPDGNPNFNAANVNLAAISASGGVLASGVYAIRFDFGNQENNWVGYSELEVIGTPTLGLNPLPTTTALTVNATLDLNGGNQQAVSLTGGGSGRITNSYVGTAAVLTLTPASGTPTFSGIIQNNGGTGGTVGLTLNASVGVVQTLSGVNTYTGGTTVTSGTLRVSPGGTLGSGNLTIASAGTLTLQNAAQTVAAFNSAGVLNLNGTVSPPTPLLTVTAGMTLQSGSNESLILGTPNGTSNPLIAVTGSLTNSGANTNEISFSNPSKGTYDLISYTSTPTNFGAFFLNPTSISNFPAFAYALQNNSGANQIDLLVTAPPVYWTGTNMVSGVTPWDTTTQNWQLAAGGSTTYSDTNGVAVFNDTYFNGSAYVPVASNSVVIQGGGVFPTLVTFNNSAVNYTLSDADSANGIGGAANIVKTGTGTVYFTSPNSFSGSVSINAGQIDLEKAGALGSSSGVVVSPGAALQLQDGVTTNVIPLTIFGTGLASAPAGALQGVSGANSYAGFIQVGAGGATITSSNPGDTLTLTGGVNPEGNVLTINGSGNTAITGASGIAGSSPGTVTYSGSGTLTLGTANSFSGLTTISSGMLSVPVGGSLAGSLTYSSGNTSTIAGTLVGPSAVLTATSGTLVLTGQSTFGGGTQLSGGTVRVGASSVVTSNTLNSGPLGTGALNLNSGTIQDNGSATTIANQVYLNGSVTFSTTGSVTSTPTLIFDSQGSSGTFFVNGFPSSSLTVNNTTQINDLFTGYTNLAISGTGTLILANPNDTAGNPSDYSGIATINSGVVQLNNKYALQNSVVTLNTPGGLTFESGIGSVALGGLQDGSSAPINLTLTDLGSNPVALMLGNTVSNNASYSGNLTGTTLTEVGTNIQTLLGNNTFTSITLNSGTLRAGPVSPGINPLGTALVTFSGGTLSLLGSSYANNVLVPTSSPSTSTISLASGVLASTIGDLSIGSSTLNVGSSDTSGSPYSVTLMGTTNTTTLTGNPTFNMIRSTGGGAGTLNLGSLNDGGTLRTITIMGNGAVALNSSTTNLVPGTQFNIGVGPIPPYGPTAGLVSEYRFAAGSGTTAYDSGPNGLNGTLVGSGVAYTTVAKTGPFALSFTSANSYVQIPQSSLDQMGSGSYTISAWVNATAFNPNSTIFSTRNNGENTFDLQITAGGLHADIGSGSGWYTTAANLGATVNTGSWYLVTYSVSPNSVTAYLNGGTTTGGSQQTTTFGGVPLLETASTYATIGNQENGAPIFATNNQFLGEIDDLRIYNTALTAAQVAALYAVPTYGVSLNSNNSTSLGSQGLSTVNLGYGGTYNVGQSQTVNQTVSGLNSSNGFGTVGIGSSSTLTVGSTDNASSSFSGTIGGTGSLIKAGTGSLTLSGTNTYSGGTTLNSGTLIAGTITSLGSNAVTLSGGTLRVAALTAPFAYSGFGGTSTSVTGATTGWTVNNTTIASNPIASNVLTLTDNNPGEARSAFYNSPVPITSGSSGFSASYVYQATGNAAGNNGADGAAFVLQEAGPTALGNSGGALGYTGIGGNSAAAELNIFSNNGLNTIGSSLNTNGTIGPNTAVSFLSSGDQIQVNLTYNPTTTTLTEVLSDLTNPYPANSANMPVTISSVVNLSTLLGSNSAYIGFTGGTGGVVSTQTISSFNYSLASSGYGNNLILTGGATAAIDVAATAASPAAMMGTLQVNNGSGTTLNVTAATAPTGVAYGLTLGAVSLNGNLAINVANNTNGGGNALGTLALGSITESGGSYGIALTGPGALLLTAGGAYSGGTTVTGGKLLVSNPSGSATGTGPVTLDSASTLGVSVASGSGSILPSDPNTVSLAGVLSGANGVTLTLGNGLVLQSGASLTASLTGTPNGTSGSNPIFAVNNSSGGTMPLDVSHGPYPIDLTGMPQVGSYDLLNYTGIGNISGSISSGTFPLGTAPLGYTYQLQYNPGGNSQIDLVVAIASFTWTGVQADGSTTNGNWTTSASDTNWATGAYPTAMASPYFDAAPVTFADLNPVTNSPVTATTITIQPAGVSPSSITFTNTGASAGGVNYTLVGGPINGTTGIKLNGTGGIGGMVTLASPNGFSGAVLINAGVLNLASSSVVSGASAALGNASSVTVAGTGASLQLSGVENFVNYGQTAASSSVTIPTYLNGSGVGGTGALVSVSGENFYEATVALTGNATIGSISTNANDFLEFDNNIDTAGNQLTFQVTPNGSGTGVYVYGAIGESIPGGSVALNGGGSLDIESANTYTGGTTVNSGALYVGESNTSSSLGSGPLTINAVGSSTVSTVNLHNSMAIGSLSGTVSGGGTARLNVSPSVTLTVNQTVSGAFPGALSLADGSSLAVNAAGQSLTLGGAVALGTSSGGTSVSANSGTVAITGSLSSNGTSTTNTLSVGNSDMSGSPVATLQLTPSAATTIASGSAGLAATVYPGGTLQLSGSFSALSDPTSGKVANVVTHGTGTANDGALSVVGTTTQTVGVVSGDTVSTSPVTTYSGNTTVGDGTNAANLTATQILQNTLTINAGSTVTIAPSGSGIPADAVAATAAVATSDVAGATATSVGDSTSDPFTAIQAAIASGSISSTKGEPLENRIAAIERLAATDSGLDVSLLEDRVLAALPTTSVWSSSGSSPLADAGSGLLAMDGSTFASSSDAASGSAAAFAPAADFGGSPAAVPEPSTLLLAILGGIGISISFRRRTICCE